MIRRFISRKRLRRLFVIGAGVLAAAGLLTATALAVLVTDSGTHDLTVPNKETSTGLVDIGNASVEYIGSSASNQASGTGLFDPFVRLQADPTEQGFNTDAPVTLDTKAGKWTHAILASAIPIVDCDGDGSGTATCWELFVDINEGNSNKRVSLNDVEIWFTDSATLSGYPFAEPGTTNNSKEYDFSGNILINDVNQGSGRGDLRYLVPTAGHPFTPTTYFVLYSRWGVTPGTAGNFGTGTYVSDGGFEEWKVRKAPNLSIVKTADAASVNAGQPIGFTITVTNNGVADATGVTISDLLPAGTGIDWSESPDNPDCSITGLPPTETLNCGPVTLTAGGGSFSVHVQSATTSGSCGNYDNTATFTSTNAGSGSAGASVTVQCGALQITKTAKHKGAGTANLVATFTIVDAQGASHQLTTNASGTGCIGGVAIGMTQSIVESTVPSGYSAPTIANVTVASGTCVNGVLTGGTNVPVENTPLTDVDIDVDSLHDGATETTITCDGVETVVSGDGSVVVANDAPPNAPNEITCTISIDP